MKFQKIRLNPRASEIHSLVENVANKAVRGFDNVKGFLRLGGRKSGYDDENYAFEGGECEVLRKKHYDKSLRLLWKAEKHMPWSSFKDCSKDELMMLNLAESALNGAEKKELDRIRSWEYRELLNREYTQREKQAIVNILSLIGHGEAYAWLVSTDVLNAVKSTGGRAALTMQVVEEAKHFVVLRELIYAFDCEVPRMSAWEYVLLERIHKVKGLEKLFGMNVVVEGFALSLFGMLCTLPGMEVLRLFHLDESRHTALPWNYFKEFPMSEWQQRNPLRQLHRLTLVLPSIPIIFQAEPDLAELGIDALDFGGSMIRKIMNLSTRVGFYPGVSKEHLFQFVDWVFNSYAQHSRYEHQKKTFTTAETTQGDYEREVEREVFRFKNEQRAQQKMQPQAA